MFTETEKKYLASVRKSLDDYESEGTDRSRVVCLLDAQEALMTLWLIVKRRQLAREEQSGDPKPPDWRQRG